MAKRFTGYDPVEKKTYQYVFGLLKEHEYVIEFLNDVLKNKGWVDVFGQDFLDELNRLKPNEKKENLLKQVAMSKEHYKALAQHLTLEEIQLLKDHKLKGYEFSIVPFMNGKTIVNAPYVHFAFEDREDYINHKFGLEKVKIRKDTTMLPSPKNGEYKVEIVKVEEVR